MDAGECASFNAVSAKAIGTSLRYYLYGMIAGNTLSLRKIGCHIVTNREDFTVQYRGTINVNGIAPRIKKLSPYASLCLTTDEFPAD